MDNEIVVNYYNLLDLDDDGSVGWWARMVRAILADS
jgi:hypothetical protein